MVSYTISGNYTDLYQLTMGEVYFLQDKKDNPVCFDYFFRKLPYKGGYVVFAGLHDLLPMLADLHFTAADLAFLKELKFHTAYLDFLERFPGAVPER